MPRCCFGSGERQKSLGANKVDEAPIILYNLKRTSHYRSTAANRCVVCTPWCSSPRYSAGFSACHTWRSMRLSSWQIVRHYNSLTVPRTVVIIMPAETVTLNFFKWETGVYLLLLIACRRPAYHCIPKTRWGLLFYQKCCIIVHAKLSKFRLAGDSWLIDLLWSIDWVLSCHYCRFGASVVHRIRAWKRDSETAARL